jgi:hypothetical protein
MGQALPQVSPSAMAMMGCPITVPMATDSDFSPNVAAILESEEFLGLTAEQLQELGLAAIEILVTVHGDRVSELVAEDDAESAAAWAADEARLQLAGEALASVDLSEDDGDEAEAA